MSLSVSYGVPLDLPIRLHRQISLLSAFRSIEVSAVQCVPSEELSDCAILLEYSAKVHFLKLRLKCLVLFSVKNKKTTTHISAAYIV